MERVPLTMEPVATADPDAESQKETISSIPSVKVSQLRLALGSVLLTGVLLAAVVWVRRPLLGVASTSSIMLKDAEAGICWITINSGCECSNCDAHIKNEKGDEVCFSTVAVKDTDDDNGECHDYATKCTLEIGQKYTAECTGDWDSGAKLQVGSLEICKKTSETKEFVAEAAPIKPPREGYEKLMEDKDYQHVVQKYGWTETFLSCMMSELGSFEKEFDKDKMHVAEWDDLEPQFRTMLSSERTCENVNTANGIQIFKACMDKQVSDDKTAHAGDDDDW